MFLHVSARRRDYTGQGKHVSQTTGQYHHRHLSVYISDLAPLTTVGNLVRQLTLSERLHLSCSTIAIPSTVRLIWC